MVEEGIPLDYAKMVDEGIPLDYEKMVDEGIPLDYEKRVDEGIPLDSEKMVDEGIPLDYEKIVDEGIPLDSEKMVDEGIPLDSEKMVDEGIPLDYENEKNVSGRDTSVDEGIPLYKDINDFNGTVNKKLRNGMDVIFSLLRNTPKLNLALMITIMTVTSTYAIESSPSRIVTIPTTVIWNQPFSITAILENTTCEYHLHWLQVSDQFNVNIIARGNLSYNESVYNIFLDYSEMSLNYTLQIKKVTFEDLKKEYRVECGRKKIPIKLLHYHEVILQPENLRKTFSIENNTLIGTIILVNMYPNPTRYCITLQTPEGKNITFDRPFLNGSENNAPNLINKTYDVRETIEKNICSGNVSVTIYVGDSVIATFSYQIFSNCSTGTDNEVRDSITLIVIVTVMSVLGVVIIVLVYTFRHKLKPCVTLIETSIASTHKPCTDETNDDGNEMKEDVFV